LMVDFPRNLLRATKAKALQQGRPGSDEGTRIPPPLLLVGLRPDGRRLVVAAAGPKPRTYFFKSFRRTRSSSVQQDCSIMLFSVLRLKVLLPAWKMTVTLRPSAGWQ